MKRVVSRRLALVLVVTAAALELACGNRPARDPSKAPKHHAPRPEVTTTWVTSMPHPGMRTAQQPASR